jgi:glucose 1-dehydrogenase
MNDSLRGKIALVSGASRGIGAAIALDLARAGADVAVNFSRSPDRAEEVCRQIRELKARAVAVGADVADVAAIRAMFDRVEAELGPVDILVNNAGIEPRRTIEEFDEATYDAIMDTNLKGAFFCAQRALGAMKAKGWGRIINISSVHEEVPFSPSSVYSLSKAGLWMLTRELAMVYSRYGITINSVAPGAVRTDLNRHVLADPDYEARVLEKIPAGWIAEPGDISKTIVFLASDAASYVTGASIRVDGGLSL